MGLGQAIASIRMTGWVMAECAEVAILPKRVMRSRPRAPPLVPKVWVQYRRDGFPLMSNQTQILSKAVRLPKPQADRFSMSPSRLCWATSHIGHARFALDL